MKDRRRVPRRTRIGTGGVVLLSSLIFVVAAIALVAGFVAVRQLGEAAAESKRLFAIQETADVLSRIQLDEETSLRGYLISRQRAFLVPYLSVPDPFEEHARSVREQLSSNDLTNALDHLEKMVAAHRMWRSRFASVLIGDPSQKNVVAMEPLGKILDDRIREEAAALREDISANNDRVEASLEANVDRTLDYSVGFVLIVSLAVLYLALAQRSTAAALTRQHSIAAHLQAALGVGWQSIPGATIGTVYVSATSDSEVGGDLFDAWRIDDERGAIMIADMSGKGIDAVVNTAFCKYSIRALLDTYRDPASVMTAFNNLFARMVSDPSMFVVAFLGVFDACSGVLEYVSAGHEPAFYRTGDEVRLLQIGGPIVGMEDDSTYKVSTLMLQRGDLVVLATDGLTEARDVRGEMLGAAGACDLIAKAPSNPQELCDALIDEVRRRGGNAVSDDLALLALRYESGGQSRSADESSHE